MAFRKGDPNNPGKRQVRGATPPPKHRRLTDEQRKQLAQTLGGITPLEYACSVLRDEQATIKDRQWACELLMPYMHRKLPVAVDISGGATITAVNAESLASLPTTELEKLINAVLKITTQTQV